MKYLIALLLTCATVSAADIEPVVWVHSATTQDVFVACYWAQQFQRFEDSKKHLLIACPKAVWKNANPTKRDKVLTALRRFLANDDPVSETKLQAVRDSLADNNVRLVLTDDPAGTLAGWGLVPPESDGPP